MRSSASAEDLERQPDPDPTGIGPHTEGIFRGALRSGRGGTLHGAMPWVAYRNLTDADIGAIYLALRELPPVAHRVASSTAQAAITSPPTIWHP